MASTVRARIPVRRRYVFFQRLEGEPDSVFALLCPIREMEWVEGWRPQLVLSTSGLVERGCVFTTSDAGRSATWLVTQHDSEKRYVEMVKFTPDYLVIRLEIDVAPGISNGTAAARIAYEYTALGEDGERFVSEFTESHWLEFMHGWESSMNRYLRGQRQLESPVGTGT